MITPFKQPLVFLVLLILALGQACSLGPETPLPTLSTSPISEPSILRLAITEDPRSFEPGLTVFLLDSQIALNLHAGLFTYDENSNLVPYLVQHWEVSDDGRIYTFQLRTDVQWHNGRLVIAEDFKMGWERYMNPDLSAWGAGYLKSIVGAQEMLDGEADSLEGVEVVDRNTLKVTLTEPDPVFLLRLGTTPTWVVPPEAVVIDQPDWEDKPIGAGPFKFADWQTKVKVVLEANPDFFNGRPSLDRVEFVVVPEPATALNMYRAGDIDVVAVPAGELKHLSQDSHLREEINYWTKAQLVFIGLNMQKVEAFKDVRVRQAFSYAIDNNKIIEKVLFNAWVPATGFVPPNVPGHNSNLRSHYDPRKARNLLAEAGYPEGENFPKLQFVTLGSTEFTAAEAVAAQLSENLGVTIEVIQPEEGDFYKNLWAHDKWDMFLTGWTADYLSAEQWLYNLLYGGLDSNFVSYNNQEYNTLIDDAMRSRDNDKRTALWEKANRTATEDGAMIPFGYGQFIYLVKPNVSGLKVNLFMPMGLETVSKD